MSPVKPGSKYFPLFEYLRRQNQDRVRLSFDAIDRLISGGLPASARQGRAFWSNRSQGAFQAQAWLDAGYWVEAADPNSGQVIFKKPKTRYRVERQGSTVLWNAGMIRALREHLGVNQAGLAEILGVRQQTVSEWETGIYRPTRGRSNHLTLVAERAAFPFEAGQSALPHDEA
jgi:DNA-binding transcriptional regulator YiaG